jgi:PAS domain S-box-containing protein
MGDGIADGASKAGSVVAPLPGQQPLLAQAFDRMPVAVVLVSADGRIVMANAQAESLFGYTAKEMEGGQLESLVPARFRHAHPDFRDHFLRAPRARLMGVGRDLFAVRRDGSEFPVEIGLNPIDTESGRMVLAAVSDITDRKQREQAMAAALREKELLLGEVHHRVKNNLQVVQSLLDLQASRSTDPLLREILRDSQNRVRSMALIHQTLYQSRDFRLVEFESFLRSLVPMLVGAHATEPARIRLELDAGAVRLPINIAIPCGLVVNELVTNALKHGLAESGGGLLRIEMSIGADNQVSLGVCNDGTPIPETLDLARSKTLGMQLVNLLTRQIDGRLEIRRADPTRVTLTFPAGG